MRESFYHYVVPVGRAWFALVVGGIGGSLGLASLVMGDSFTVPPWIWVPVLIGGLFVAQFLAFHRIRLQRDALAHRRGVRERLGQFLGEGQQIKVRCANEREEAPAEEADEWAGEVATYLASELGEDYAESFYSSDGLPMGVSSISSLRHRNVSGFMGNRLARLNEFLRELRRG